MTFIRKGTAEPSDFIDRAVRRRHSSEEAAEKHETPQARLKALFDTYKEKNALIRLNIDGNKVTSTPLLVREYGGDAETYDAEVGIGCRLNEEDPELAIVLIDQGETFLLAVPQNGVDGVPETHGVEQLLGWLESRYPMIYP